MSHKAPSQRNAECRRPILQGALLKWSATFSLMLFSLGLCPAVELQHLKVLYVGNAKSARAADFKAFLSTNVAQVEVRDRIGFDPAFAAPYDVVLLDWPQSESRAEFPPKKSPLGERNTWTKPMVLLGSAGLHLAIVWDVQGGFG